MLAPRPATILFLVAFAVVAFSPSTVKADAFLTVRIHDASTDPDSVIDHSGIHAPISIADTVSLPRASASAAANLQDGTLRIFLSASPSGDAVALAGFSDNLTFISAPGGPTSFIVTIGMNVNGSMSNSNSAVGARLRLGSQIVDHTYGSGPGPFNGTFSDTLLVNHSVTSGTPLLMQGVMNTTGVLTGQGTINFSNTASVFLSLPPGVTFTSESGAFLTQGGPGAVPEPTTMLLLGTGLLGVAARVMRRK